MKINVNKLNSLKELGYTKSTLVSDCGHIIERYEIKHPLYGTIVIQVEYNFHNGIKEYIKEPTLDLYDVEGNTKICPPYDWFEINLSILEQKGILEKK